MGTYVYEDTPQGRIYYGTQYVATGEVVNDPAVLEGLKSGKIEATPKATTPVQAPFDPKTLSVAGNYNGKPVYRTANNTFYTTTTDASGKQIIDQEFTGTDGTGNFIPKATSTPDQAPTVPPAQQNPATPTPTTSQPPTTPTAPNQPATGQPPTGQPTLTPEQQAAQQANQATLDQLLANPSLTPDQKAAIQAIYNAVSTNDQSQADRIKAAIAAATQYSDPYFKAQTRMVLDSLDRGFQAIDDDLGYKENSLTKSLQALQRDIAASKDHLSFQQLQEMKSLERTYTQSIQSTQEDMAARGFSSSSIRSRKEQLITDTFGDLRESSNRAFLAKEQSYANQLSDVQTNTAAEIARLQQLAASGKLDATRAAEAQVGSTALTAAGYTGGLGEIGGAIPAAQVRDANAFASQFVF